MNSFRNLWDNNRRGDICVIGVPEAKERESSIEVFKEVMVENFLQLAKVTKLHIQEMELISNWVNTMKSTPEDITI